MAIDKTCNTPIQNCIGEFISKTQLISKDLQNTNLSIDDVLKTVGKESTKVNIIVKIFLALVLVAVGVSSYLVFGNCEEGCFMCFIDG